MEIGWNLKIVIHNYLSWVVLWTFISTNFRVNGKGIEVFRKGKEGPLKKFYLFLNRSVNHITIPISFSNYLYRFFLFCILNNFGWLIYRDKIEYHVSGILFNI